MNIDFKMLLNIVHFQDLQWY